MTLPSIDSLSSYGGLQKANYLTLPPANPITDYDNTLITPAFCNVAGMTSTADRFQIRMTLASTTGGLVLNNWFAVWQNATNTSPILARSNTGIFTVTLPGSVTDEYSQSLGTPITYGVNMLSGTGNIEGATALYSVSISCVANVITINCMNGGGLNDFAGSVLFARIR